MFQDEARFGRSQDPRACWAPPGIRPVVTAQFVRDYLYAFAAVSPHDGTLDALVLPFVDAAAMSLFLGLVKEYLPEGGGGRCASGDGRGTLSYRARSTLGRA